MPPKLDTIVALVMLALVFAVFLSIILRPPQPDCTTDIDCCLKYPDLCQKELPLP